MAAARWRYARDPRFAFGTWKLKCSAVLPAPFSCWVWRRLSLARSSVSLRVQLIHYQQAIAVAIVGLIVNIVCARILGHSHDHHDHAQHEHGHHDDHGHDHQHDLNLKSAYIHVIADAATSVLAIVALLGGWIYGWSWLDPVAGIVGAVLVAIWAKGLIAETGKVCSIAKWITPSSMKFAR